MVVSIQDVYKVLLLNVQYIKQISTFLIKPKSCQLPVPGMRITSFMTCHHVCNKSNLTGITSQAGTAYPSEAHDFILVFCEIRIAQFFVLSVMLCRSLYVPFLLAIESHRWCNV